MFKEVALFEDLNAMHHNIMSYIYTCIFYCYLFSEELASMEM